MLIVFAVLLVCVVGALVLSPAAPAPFLGQDGRPLAGSISEKLHININGVEQGMFISCKDKTKLARANAQATP